jgi:hypothetical protein
MTQNRQISQVSSAFQSLRTYQRVVPHFLSANISNWLLWVNSAAVFEHERDQVRHLPRLLRDLIQSGWDFELEDFGRTEYWRISEALNLEIEGKAFKFLTKVEPDRVFERWAWMR